MDKVRRTTGIISDFSARTELKSIWGQYSETGMWDDVCTLRTSLIILNPKCTVLLAKIVKLKLLASKASPPPVIVTGPI